MIKYLQRLGFNVTNDMFANHSWFFRNALVRANYDNLQKGITQTTLFLERFFRNMLLGEKHSLRNREMHIDWEMVKSQETETQSAEIAPAVFQKCKNCTLEEAALIAVVRQSPKATQKEIAGIIGKSERTVKTITVKLQERGILMREGGKRNGSWSIN